MAVANVTMHNSERRSILWPKVRVWIAAVLFCAAFWGGIVALIMR